MANVTVTNTTNTIVIATGADASAIVATPEKVKVYIKTLGRIVRIGWSANEYLEYDYADFASPSGASAAAVAAQIASYLDL